MASERTNKDRLDVIEKRIVTVEEQVTNHIPHQLDNLHRIITDLSHDQGKVYEAIIAVSTQNTELRGTVDAIIRNLNHYHVPGFQNID